MTASLLVQKPGPKVVQSREPLDTEALGPRDHRRLRKFSETYLLVPKGKGALSTYKPRPWQREIDAGLWPAKGKRPRQGLIAVARGNGKSTDAARRALYALFADDVEGPQVLIVASDFRQAGIIFNICRRMIELSPELSARAKVLKDRIETPFNDGLLMPLPAEEAALQGWDPSACFVDELHVVTRDVWESMILASGKRADSLVLAISTPADSRDSVMWSLVEQARATPSPDFFFREWTSDPSHPIDCKHCEKAANPALGDFLSRDSMASVRRTSRESSYRRLRLGQWLEVTEDQWLTPDLIRATTDEHDVADGARVVLAVDGSRNGDATAITVTSIEPTPHIDLVALWEPNNKPEGYTVPVHDVEQVLREACGRWRVEEINFDPYLWTRSMQVLDAEGFPIIEHPQSAQRMTPATVGLYEAFTNGTVTHSGNPDLVRHLLNAEVVEDSRGTRIHKPKGRENVAKIDAAVCSIMGHARAQFHAHKKQKKRRVVGF